MTTPSTPAGWYPDPDGSAGQRYWDGSAWTEHRSPGLQPTPEPSEPPAPEPPVSEQSTVVVPTRPVGERVGAHRVPEPEAEPEPPTEPEPGPTAPADQPTTRVTLPTAPPVEPTSAFTERTFTEPAFTEPAFAERPFAGALPEPPSFAPPPAPTDEPSTPGDDRRKLIVWFSAACAALLAVLVLVFIYALFIQEDNTVQIGATDKTTTTSESPTETTTASETTETTETESPTAAPGGETVDGPLSFELIGVETGTTVSSTDAPIEKTAQGEFIVVRLSVVNTSDAPATFLGTFQKLNAGGATYSIDDEASFYVGGGFVEIPPGGQATVGVAYDVPPGTVAESIELHADPISAGVVLPL